MITECGTGKIYVVHSSGDNTPGFEGLGWFRLTRLSWGPGGIEESTMIEHTFTQTLDCWTRGGASVHIGPSGNIDFYCHSRGILPNGFFYRTGLGNYLPR
jgi:hypothetical protein